MEHSTRLIQLGSHLFYNTHAHVFDIQLFEIIIREKSFPEMKKDVGMTTAQKSKETRMEMGSIFVLYIQPTIPTYTSGSFRL